MLDILTKPTAKLYEEELREFEEDLESLDRKAQLAAEAIRKAEHVVVYTGAGISTSADLPGSSADNSIESHKY